MRTLEYELEGYQRYRDISHSAFSQALAEIGESGKDLAPEQQEEYFDWRYDDIAEVRDSFPQLLRGTSLVALYTIFEDTLFRLCKMVRSDAKVTLQPKDMRGDGIDLAKRFVVKGCNREFPSDSTEWSRIQLFRKIRNCIVHANGYVRADQRVEIHMVRGVSLSNQSKVLLEESVLDDFTKDIRGFFTLCESTVFREAT